MCIFKKKPKIPYPEEKSDYSITQANCDIDSVFDKWITTYEVPLESKDYFIHNLDVQVYDVYPNELLARFGNIRPETPAFTWVDEKRRHLAVKPEYLNVGTIAHEEAHNSYLLLSDKQKQDFAYEFNLYAELKSISDVYFVYKGEDEIVNYLLKTYKRYEIHGSAIELHAEIYRFLGQYMPESLKQFYPKLF